MHVLRVVLQRRTGNSYFSSIELEAVHPIIAASATAIARLTAPRDIKLADFKIFESVKRYAEMCARVDAERMG
eukprot:scaffold329357_cov46-Prasinocladus_malaysianus.AAC.2